MCAPYLQTSGGVFKKGIFPVVLNELIGLGKDKKGNYPCFDKKNRSQRLVCFLYEANRILNTEWFS
jgi:hypothetical protein